MIDEKRVIEKVLSGDLGSFQLLVEEYQRLVAHIVFRMIHNPQEREDISQDVFLKIYQNLKNFKFNSKLSTWIAKIAYNTCLNFLEKNKVELYDDLELKNPLSDVIRHDSLQPDESTIRGDIFDKLQKEIENLPVRYRVILTLYHLDEMSYKEIGSTMALPEGTVKNYLFRARKYLKENLSKKYQTEDLYQ